MDVSPKPLHGPTELELSDFQFFLTTRKAMTSTEAIAICRDHSHETYLTLWREFEAACKQECEGGNG
jgi:hypothetical protein